MTKRRTKKKTDPATFYYKPKTYRPVEDRHWYRRLFVILGMIVLILAIFWFWGISLIANLDEIWGTFRTVEEEPEIRDTLAPLPPKFNSLPQATNKPTINISGFSEPGTTVKVFLNDDLYEQLLANKDGSFSFDKIFLKKGKNHIYTTATDSAGNESHPSKVFIITFDEKAPEIHIEEPADDEEFKGREEGTIQIKGSVSKNADLTINESKVIVGGEGEFTFFLTLEEGENTIKFEAVDEAGNKTQEQITVKYSLEKEKDRETSKDE